MKNVKWVICSACDGNRGHICSICDGDGGYEVDSACKSIDKAEALAALERNVQSCHNNISIFDTTKYVKLEDAKRIIEQLKD